jgi:hypothetical protein
MNQALQKTWQVRKLKMEQTPVKSSLSEARSKVSYKFFEDIYQKDLKKLSKSRRTYQGFHIYAVDGDDLNLPASGQVLKQGYRGSRFDKQFETYYPKMYTVYSYDILNGTVHDFSFSNKFQEFSAAVNMAQDFEKNSIAIYDRLFCGYSLIKAHLNGGSHCLIRAKVNGPTVHRPVKKFLESCKNELIVDWYPHNKQGQDGIRVRLVKIVNPKTKKIMVFATTLPKKQFSRKDIQKLYQKRWEIETHFRDLTQTLKMNQWHSKNINGILQEIFALLWFVNNVKMQMTRFAETTDFLKQEKYQKSNFKLCAKLIVEHIDLVIDQKLRDLSKLLEFWIKRTRESRKHGSRKYQRVVKGKLSKFPVHSKILRRAAC